ncbi:hypothetical protein CWI51_10120, partial [Neisseria meningitidis]
RGDTYGGWRYFANFGGRYAGNAAAIFGKGGNLNGFNFLMKKRGGKLWGDTGGKKNVSYKQLPAPETREELGWRLLVEKKK